MSDGITVTTKGAPDLQLKFKKLVEKVSNRKGLHDAIGAAVVSRIVHGFSRSEGPYGPWRPLAPATIRRRRGGSDKPLLDTGRLRNSITHEANSLSVLVGTNVEYAAFHQFGTKRKTTRDFTPRTKSIFSRIVAEEAKRIGTTKIPRRAFLPDMGLPNEWIQEDVLDTAEAFLKAGL